jgi:hypothetical protein
VDTQKASSARPRCCPRKAYNNVTKKRGTYGVPLRAAVVPCHIWRPAGGEGRLQDRGHPKTWDAYFDFFKKVQDNLRKQGERKVYGLGFQVTANGGRPYNLFWRFSLPMAASDIVTKDGKLHLDDPKSSRRRSRRGLPRRRLPGRLRARRARSTGTTPTTTTPSTRSSW